ncbi:MAG: MTH1187 family thiamine-binding protein [Deltaproteobacteria bacterium]|nr:MTH1187 family thiamine-binding protein [Deltaproteobacteria bacterium]
MTLMELAMYPVDKGESLSAYVAKLLDVIDESGLQYQLGPMGTVIEGEWDELVALLTRCHQTLAPLSNRIIANVKFDSRKGSTNRLKGKVNSVTEKMSQQKQRQVGLEAFSPGDGDDGFDKSQRHVNHEQTNQNIGGRIPNP